MKFSKLVEKQLANHVNGITDDRVNIVNALSYIKYQIDRKLIKDFDIKEECE